MVNVPVYVGIIFGCTTLLTTFLFYNAAGNSRITLLVIFLWLALQAVISFSGFYTLTTVMPPRFLLLVLPPLLTILLLFLTPRGRKYLDGLNLKFLTIIHVIRIPVELVLFVLFVHRAVPQLMTFEGWNFDILSGLTAPVFYYLYFVRKKISRNVMLAWHMVCLGLLINIVVIAVMSAPFPFQQLAFNQPNIAVLYFPFVWLPCCVVPLVLLSHLASIRKLIRKNNK